MRKLRYFLLLVLVLFPDVSWSLEQFNIGDYRVLVLFGEARLAPDVNYVSFTGDFGFSGRLPTRNAIEKHVAQESALLANFELKVINLEFMLPGNSGLEADRQIDDVMIDMLKRSGYGVVSRANNHAMDLGDEGFDYNTRRLQQAGLGMIGPRAFPAYQWEMDGRRIAIFALTDYTDHPDSGGLILKINEPDLAMIREKVSAADFRIAFVHLGSMSFYPSPHEREQVNLVLDTGADLVVGTGSHFFKGFVKEKGKPVIYGIGNHMFSYVDGDTEPVGVHLVAGFRKGQLVQLFVVPFHNVIMKGNTGPLDEKAFASFQKTLLDRSTTDPSRYYSDPGSLAKLKERLLRLRFEDLKDLRARYVIYAVAIAFYHYPLLVTAIFAAILALTVWLVRGYRRRAS